MTNKENCNYLDIVRFIGIYLVVLGHTEFDISCNIIPKSIYTFHMPLFFMVSGLLHKPKAFSFKELGKLSFSYLVPFAIYFFFPLVLFHLRTFGQHPFQLDILFKQLITADAQHNMVLWFIIALYQVKLIAFLCKRKWHFLVCGSICFAIWCIMHYCTSNYSTSYPYKLDTAFMAFPIFAFGYLIRGKLELIQNKTLQVCIFLVATIAIILYTDQFRTLNMAQAYAPNYILWLIMALIGSLGIIYLSKFLTPYIACNFIKTISRGTMLILGTHHTLMLHNYYPIGFNIILTFLFLSLYFIPIRLTYNNNLFGCLYGKLPRKKVAK